MKEWKGKWKVAKFDSTYLGSIMVRYFGRVSTVLAISLQQVTSVGVGSSI